jgi:hypothetical protein
MASMSSRPSRVGLTLSIGAGTGAVVGLLVAGGPGIAIGLAAGAGLGVIAGALWDQRSSSKARTA